MKKTDISKYMSSLGKLSQKKSPTPKAQFKEMARKRWDKKKISPKLSTPPIVK